MRGLLAIAVLGVLLGALLVIRPAEAATDRVLTIDSASAGPTVDFEDFDASPPKLFDFDGDGTLEILVQNDNRYVYVFDSQDGTLQAELQTQYPPGWGARSLNGPEAAILEVGGVPHIVVANSAAFVTAFRYEHGTSSHGNFDFTKLWQVRLKDCHDTPSMDSKPVLADLDNDGDLDILAYTEEVGGYALRMDGSIIWKKCIGGGNSEPAADDLDFDGDLEVVFVSDGGVVTTVDGHTGTTLWTFWAANPIYDLGAASIPVGASIGQVDGVGPLDIVFGTRDSHDPDDWSQNHAALFALSGSGNLLWMRQDSAGNPLTYTRPIIHDIDGDGLGDVFWGDWNTVGHKPPYPGDDPGPWAPTGPANFFRYEGDGDLVWRQSLDTYWSNKDLALADVDDDGVQEVLANGPGPGGDGIWYLNGLTGAKETFVSTHPWKVTRGPVLEDLWDTGTMQWVVPVSAATSSVSGGAVLVYDTHVPFDAAWPHVPYPEPTNGTSPPSGGTFEAVFTVPSSVNEWWVEVDVSSTRAVNAVSASVDGGGPRALVATSWGTWAKSFFVPEGSSVVFTAMDVGGDSVDSDIFYWLTGEPPPPPDPGDFEATFTVTSSVNNWWVEVRVQGNHPVASVTANVEGVERALSKTDWGTWAKSFHVPTGTAVVFEATDTGGASMQSETFYWLSSGPPPPPGPFSATFTVPSSVNQWWVEVDVDATMAVTGVEAIVDGGAPVVLSKKSWGNWAKSFFVEAGSEVVFRATASDGSVNESGVFVWLVSGSGPFAATFTPGDTTNNWWVETSVSANRVVVGVDARVDGAWIALSKTGWGTWAKSFFVPDGATVTFRATDGEGFVESSGYVWGQAR